VEFSAKLCEIVGFFCLNPTCLASITLVNGFSMLYLRLKK